MDKTLAILIVVILNGSIPLTALAQLAGSIRSVAAIEADSSSSASSLALTRMLAAAANLYGLDPALMAAIAVVESGNDPAAVSPRGAIGIMQLMPQTAARFGVNNPADPIENLLGAARFLSYLRRSAAHRPGAAFTLPETIAAYNAGAGAINKYGGIPPYAETQRYVRKVLLAYLTNPASAAPARPNAVSASSASRPPAADPPGAAPANQRGDYSAADAAAEEEGDPFRELQLILRRRAAALSHKGNGNQPAAR